MPDTAAYYHAAYVVAGALYAGYAFSLWWRARRAARGAAPEEPDVTGRSHRPPDAG